MSPPLPAVGFKEWSLVCSALGSGAQSIILRKGGIHEGRGGFWWRHDRFFLFPTQFHEQTVQFPWEPPLSADVAPSNLEPEEGGHLLEYFAEVERKAQILEWETVQRLKPLHFWTEETLRERFDYSEATGISLAFVRVYRLNKPWVFPGERRFGGCRSWLDLPAVPEDVELSPVLDDAAHQAAADHLRRIIEMPVR